MMLQRINYVCGDNVQNSGYDIHGYWKKNVGLDYKLK